MERASQWKLSDVKKRIDNKVKESNYLEYKASAALDQNHPSNKRKNIIFEISKDISAFANAGGGTIIYGVREETPLAIGIDEGLDPDKVTKEWLEQIIKAYIQPAIEGYRIDQINLEGDKEGCVIYAVHIPQSERGVHQAADKKCYTRRNFRAEPMEIYEIRDVLTRKKVPDVRLDLFFRRLGSRRHCFPLGSKDAMIRHGLEINGGLRNEGGGEVHYVAITLIFDVRLEPECAQEEIEFRPLKMVLDGREWDVLSTNINWGGPSKMPLFRTVEFQLLEKEIHVHFRTPLLKEDFPPFIQIEIKAANMEPNISFIRFRLENNSICIKQEEVPAWSEILQDGRNRDFLKIPDLSTKPNLV